MKVYLTVPYCDKDIAKQLGARWDSGCWFVEDMENLQPFLRWMPANLVKPIPKPKTGDLPFFEVKGKKKKKKSGKGKIIRPCHICETPVNFILWEEETKSRGKRIFHWANADGSHHEHGKPPVKRESPKNAREGSAFIQLHQQNMRHMRNI